MSLSTYTSISARSPKQEIGFETTTESIVTWAFSSKENRTKNTAEISNNMSEHIFIRKKQFFAKYEQ